MIVNFYHYLWFIKLKSQLVVVFFVLPHYSIQSGNPSAQANLFSTYRVAERYEILTSSRVQMGARGTFC